MKSTVKISNRRRSIIANIKFKDIIFTSVKSNKNLNIHTDDEINYRGKSSKKKLDKVLKNSELYKKNLELNKESIKYFFNMKIYLMEKIYCKYSDCKRNYNIMIINNILSNRVSKIKIKYTEMLNEIETAEIISKYITKKEIYYFLKYLLVVLDKFSIQYPNYLKDEGVYNFMSKYLYKKQQFIDRASENNKKNYIQSNIKKLFHEQNFNESRIFNSKMSQSDYSEEENLKKKIKTKGYNNDVENSQESYDNIEKLVEKMDKKRDKMDNLRIFVRRRSKTIKTDEIFLFKIPKNEKSKKIKLTSLYEINNKKVMRSKKRKKTEIKLDRKMVTFETAIDEHDKNKTKKTKKSKKNIIEKKNEIKEIKRLFLLNDIGKNNKVLDVLKRGFFFIDEKDIKKYNKNEKLKSNKNKNNIIEDINKIHKENKLKDKINLLYQNKNNYYNGENYLILKNMNYILKNLNYNLNEYRFYNKIKSNNNEKEKYYEKNIIPGLFNDKANLLLNSQNLNLQNKKNKKSVLIPSLGVNSQINKTYNSSTESFCKRLVKLNESLLDKKNKKNDIIIPYYNSQKKNDYFKEYYIDSIITDKDRENSKYSTNKLERIENSINQYYRTNSKDKKILSMKNNINYIKNITLNNDNNLKNKIDKNRLNNILITSRNYRNNLSSKLFKSEYKNYKEKAIFNTMNNITLLNNNIYTSENDFTIRNISHKNIKGKRNLSLNIINRNKSKDSSKIHFYDVLNSKNKDFLIKL